MTVRLRLFRTERARDLNSGSASLRYHRVNHERILRYDRLGAGIEKAASNQVEYVIRTIANGQLV